MLIDESLGVSIRAEGKHVRVTIGERGALFAGCTPEQFLRDLQMCVAAIPLAHCAVDLEGAPLVFTPQEQTALRRDIALHWMRYCLSVRTPIRITPDDLAHPQTWSIVLRAAEAKYGLRSAAATALAAQVVGLERTELERWRRVEEDRLSNM
jgi:hypothetical protein